MTFSWFPVVSGGFWRFFLYFRLRVCEPLRILLLLAAQKWFAFLLHPGAVPCYYICVCFGVVIYIWTGFRSGSGSSFVQSFMQSSRVFVQAVLVCPCCNICDCDMFMFLWFWFLWLEDCWHGLIPQFLRRGECFAPHLAFACQEWVLQVNKCCLEKWYWCLIC